MTVLRQKTLQVLDALLLLYWLVFVGAGVSEWMIGTQRIFSPLFFSLLHWGMFLCLGLRAFEGFRHQWATRTLPSLWQIGIAALFVLAAVDGLLRSGLTEPVVKSNLIGCLLIAFFSLSFREESALRVMTLAIATLVATQVVMLMFELFNDRFLSDSYGRAAGLLVNPNDAGSALALTGLLCSRFLPRRLVPAFLILVGFGVVLTLSRSSFIAFGIGVAFLAGWYVMHGQAERLIAGWGLSAGVLAACSLIVGFALQGEGRFKFALADQTGGIYKLTTGEDRRQVESEVQKLLSRQRGQRYPEMTASGARYPRQLPGSRGHEPMLAGGGSAFHTRACIVHDEMSPLVSGIGNPDCAAPDRILDSVIRDFDYAADLGFNPDFSDWMGRFPAGWSNWANGQNILKNRSDDSPPPLSGRYIPGFATNGVQSFGITRLSESTPQALPLRFAPDAAIVGSFDAFISERRSGDGAGVLVRWYDRGSPGYLDAFVKIDPGIIGRWQRVYFKVSQQDSESSPMILGPLGDIQIYLAASWNGYGARHFDGTIYFDNVHFAVLSAVAEVPPDGDLELFAEELALREASELNSALTRQILLERAIDTFLEHPLLGVGAARSFELVPHNSFLHAANSFGVMGLVALFVFLSGYFVRGCPDGYRIAFGLSLVVVMAFMHGALTNNPIIIAVAASMVFLRDDAEVHWGGRLRDGTDTLRS